MAEDILKVYNLEITVLFSLILGYILLYCLYLKKRTNNNATVRIKPLSRNDIIASRIKYFTNTTASTLTTNNQEKNENSDLSQSHVSHSNLEPSSRVLDTRMVGIDLYVKKETIENEITNSINDDNKKDLSDSIKYNKNIICEELVLSPSNIPDSFSNPATAPLKSLEQLMAWTGGFDEFSVGRIPRKHVSFPKGKPKTMICHDMRGGYVEDRFPQGFKSSKCYRFSNWNHIESFCYFSHNLISIPPSVWTNAAHTHGVKVFGTVITEWDEGAEICQIMLLDEEQVARVVKKLVDIAVYYQFDGWLINIENEVMLFSKSPIIHSCLSSLQNFLHEGSLEDQV